MEREKAEAKRDMAEQELQELKAEKLARDRAAEHAQLEDKITKNVLARASGSKGGGATDTLLRRLCREDSNASAASSTSAPPEDKKEKLEVVSFAVVGCSM